MSGYVYLVGAGPGDPGLITVKGSELLARADVVIYDRLISPLLLQCCKEDAQQIYVGKLPNRHTLNQEEINELLIEKANEGKHVVRLKGGDPFIFGRGGEEAECCVEAGIPFEVVPGIPSAIAVPAYAGIPVTHRDYNSSFTVVTGHENPDKTTSSINWEKLATASETTLFLMGVSNLPFIVSQLTQHGKRADTPIALIRWGTRVEQETLTGTLTDIVTKVRENSFSSPCIIIVGEVVNLREKLAWFEKKPLFGKRVLVTRARNQNSELCKCISELGGEAIQFPVIKLLENQDKSLLDKACQELNSFDWVIFTSVNGVSFFFQRLRQLKIDIRNLTKARIAAIGPQTAALLNEKGLVVEVVPTEFKAEALVDHLRPLINKGDNILLPRADLARDVLPVELNNMGCTVTNVDVYETKLSMENAVQVIEMLRHREIDVITFTSSSTVKNFVTALAMDVDELQELLTNCQVVCIGPITAETASSLGVKVERVAREYTIKGLIAELCHLKKREDISHVC